MSDRTILFDFDNTLFDTGGKFKSYLFEGLAAALAVSDRQVAAATTEYQQNLSDSTDFDPDTYLQHLATVFDSSAEKLAPALYNPHIYQASVFPEVKTVLTQLQDRYPLGLFTQGVESWQQGKFERSGLLPFFQTDLIFISRRKTSPTFLAQLPKPSIIIDDRPDFIARVQTQPDLAPILIDRENKHPDPNAIHTLSELLQLV